MPATRPGRMMMVWVLLMASSMAARGDDAVTVAGTWVGHYGCAQGTTGLTLTVTAARKPRVRALFHFYADKSNPSVPEGCFEMEGTFDSFSGRVELHGGKWIVRPEGYVTVDFEGEVSPGGDGMTGLVVGPFCDKFELHRVASSSPRSKGTCPPRGAAISLLGQR